MTDQSQLTSRLKGPNFGSKNEPSSALHNRLGGKGRLDSSEMLNPSTIRARLQSPQPLARPVAKRADALSNNGQMGRYLRDFFTMNSSPPPQVAEPDEEKTKDALDLLRESFAKAGLKIHASASEEINKVHEEIASHIALLSEPSAQQLSQAKALYDNISYPLDATLCHSDTIPRASIAQHLSNLGEKVSQAEEELRQLHEEWDACIRTEVSAEKELSGNGEELGRRLDLIAADEDQQLAGFKDEAESIAREKLRMLEDIEADFKQKLQNETFRMMQSLMAD